MKNLIEKEYLQRHLYKIENKVRALRETPDTSASPEGGAPIQQQISLPEPALPEELSLLRCYRRQAAFPKCRRRKLPRQRNRKYPSQKSLQSRRKQAFLPR